MVLDKVEINELKQSEGLVTLTNSLVDSTEIDTSNSNQFRGNALEKDIGQITNNPHLIARRFLTERNKRIIDVDLINSIQGISGNSITQ